MSTVSALALLGQHAGRVAPVGHVRRLLILEEGVPSHLSCQRYSLTRLFLHFNQITGCICAGLARRQLVSTPDASQL